MEKDILKKEVERKNGSSRWNQGHHVMVIEGEEAGPREQMGKQVQEQQNEKVYFGNISEGITGKFVLVSYCHSISFTVVRVVM